MASHRPYRAALGISAALQEIESHKGDLYDPAVADACQAVFKSRGFHFD
jgi:HD-GYP domain-containing protein (c-di-GMP phosphodiesterase class II)